jgi:hypothetical protein
VKLTSSLRKIGAQLIHPWVAATAVVGLLSAVPATSFAAAPPANTLIGNQATATYLDPNGQPQSSSSNQVQTTIQQVGSFNLDTFTTTTSTVVNTKTAAAGTTVYAPHVLTNTGNGTDSFDIKVEVGPNGSGAFNRMAVFKDANFDGLPDDNNALCNVTSGTCTVATPQAVSGNGGKFGFVVAYTLPATATTPTTPFASGRVTASPIAASQSLYASTNLTASDLDNVNLTTNAAFNLSKTVSQPASGVTAPGGGAWPAAVNSGQRSSSATCATTWSAGLTSTATCKYTVYTLTYSNTGGAPGTFVMKDDIGTGTTAGLVYVQGSAVWSNAPGTALSETAPGSGTTAGSDFKVTTSGSGSSAVSNLVFVDSNVPVNVTRSVSFVVLVDSTAVLGTSTTTNVAKYNPNDAAKDPITGNPVGTPPTASNPGDNVTTTSNGSPYDTTGTYNLTLSSNAGTASTGKDSTAGTPNADANDTTTVPSAPIGGSVPFTVKVWNGGNDIDTVNIVATNPGTAGGTAFPTGTIFQYFKADGATPLTDTNGDGIPDTGPVQPGESTNVVVKAILPSTVAAGSGPYTLTVTGTSANDSSIKDATKDVLTAVTGIPVDVTNTAGGSASGTGADVGPLPANATPTTTNVVAAGATTTFSLFIKNNDTTANSYALSAASTNSFPGTLPAGWTVKFVAGDVTAANCASTTGITTTASVGSNVQSQITACVTVPASQTAVTAQPLYFQVKSTAAASNGNIVVDVKLDAVTVTNNTYSAIVGPAVSTGQTTPGGSVVYPQTLTNTGTQSCAGPYTVTATLPPADVTAGWQAAVYLDANNDGVLDAGDTLVTGSLPGPLAVGASQKFLVKVFSAGGAAVGATDTATITVTFPTGATSCGAPTSTATTTIVTGQIRVLKTQAIDTACTAAVGTQVQTNLTAKPGQCVVYQVTATNQGTSTVSNLAIKDAVPAYTSLTTTQPATKCASTGVSPAMNNSNYSNDANSVTCGGGTNSMQPGGTMTLTFQVQINQ